MTRESRTSVAAREARVVGGHLELVARGGERQHTPRGPRCGGGRRLSQRARRGEGGDSATGRAGRKRARARAGRGRGRGEAKSACRRRRIIRRRDQARDTSRDRITTCWAWRCAPRRAKRQGRRRRRRRGEGARGRSRTDARDTRTRTHTHTHAHREHTLPAQNGSEGGRAAIDAVGDQAARRDGGRLRRRHAVQVSRAGRPQPRRGRRARSHRGAHSQGCITPHGSASSALKDKIYNDPVHGECRAGATPAVVKARARRSHTRRATQGSSSCPSTCTSSWTRWSSSGCASASRHAWTRAGSLVSAGQADLLRVPCSSARRRSPSPRRSIAGSSTASASPTSPKSGSTRSAWSAGSGCHA